VPSRARRAFAKAVLLVLWTKTPGGSGHPSARARLELKLDLDIDDECGPHSGEHTSMRSETVALIYPRAKLNLKKVCGVLTFVIFMNRIS